MDKAILLSELCEEFNCRIIDDIPPKGISEILEWLKEQAK